VGQFQVDDMGQFQSELIVTSKPESVDLCDRILQDDIWVSMYSGEPTPWTMLVGPAIDFKISENSQS